jgi:hypothetical protein
LKRPDPFAQKPPPRGKIANLVTNDQFHPHALLEQARQSLLRSLVDLVAEGRKIAEPYRHRAEEVLKQVFDIEQAQRDIAPGPSNKYARHKRAIEAILDYLAERSRPASEQDITRALIQGGFRGGDPGAEDDIGKSFRSYISGTGRKTVEKNPERGIRSLKGLIGIASWPDDYWEQ